MKKLEKLVSDGVDAYLRGELERALHLNNLAIYHGRTKSKLTNDTKQLLHSNKGFTLMKMALYDDAFKQFELAFTYKPNDEDGWSKFLCIANEGKFDRAKKFHHHRYGKTRTANTKVVFPDLPFAKTVSDIIHRKVLVLNEQGLGDEILFFSAIRKLAWSCDSIHLQCYPETYRLFKNNLPSNVTLFTERSLDKKFVEVFDTITNTGDMFVFGSGISTDYRYYLEVPEREKKGYGYCWRANAKSPNAKLRSIDPELMKGFPAEPFVTFRWNQSLQLDDYDVPDWMQPMPKVEDLYDTACIIAGLEGVITVDTAIAHLAGAMHVPTTLLINEHWDWRWRSLDDNGFSLFYPSVKVVKL